LTLFLLLDDLNNPPSPAALPADFTESVSAPTVLRGNEKASLGNVAGALESAAEGSTI
jgi:hypothetical protein